MADDYKLRKIGNADAERSRINELIGLLNQRLSAIESTSSGDTSSGFILTGPSSLVPNARVLSSSSTIVVNDAGAGNAVSMAIASSSITNGYLAPMSAHTIKGNNSGASATPSDLTGTEVTALLDAFTSANKGLVPAPGTTNGHVLKDTGWSTLRLDESLLTGSRVLTIPDYAGVNVQVDSSSGIPEYFGNFYARGTIGSSFTDDSTIYLRTDGVISGSASGVLGTNDPSNGSVDALAADTDSVSILLTPKLPSGLSPSLSGTQNNYGLTAGVSAYRVTATANVTFTGLALSLSNGTDNAVIAIRNVSTANTVTLKHEDGGSTATNRFKLPNNADVVLQAYDSILLVYDPTLARWMKLA